jgi:hypothetical protein
MVIQKILQLRIHRMAIRFGGNGRGVDRMDVVKLAPGVGPARNFINVAAAIEMMKSSVGIGL